MKRKGIAQWFAAWLLLAACVECVHAQARDPLIERMAANENLLLSDISKHAPLVETYLQIMSKNGETPVADRYFSASHRPRPKYSGHVVRSAEGRSIETLDGNEDCQAHSSSCSSII